MAAETYADLLAAARGSALVNQAAVERIAEQVAGGELSESAGARRLGALYQGRMTGEADLTDDQVGAEWVKLLDGMQAEAEHWRRIAHGQYRQGFYLLPLAVLIVFGLAVFASHWLGLSDVLTAGLAGTALAALATHSFAVFRIHQQARIAAERLSEKRAAILFLQAALRRAGTQDALTILSAAASMFLGHHAPETLPLSPDDAHHRPRTSG
ncbi:hypothetical protein [Labedaea rhizosphaerae]|uniref:Uncharacterized protein n=1 Tax=Labedaea rhizosphaerae TaxID=598644 RepID=A0A4R6SDN4_LABRH|nr:hypothetical protein [Labedaea rhizosphaerae]TDP97982.1 hypothetical protein EV186_103962 [Labedaea rhizosphaerae]